MSVELEEKHTEASVLALLRKRHAAKNGNGPEWADVEKVRDAPGFDAMRTADAMALGLWKSGGHELHGFEVKVSRSDWRRELADPAKAEGWCEIVDRWWIVAPRGVVPRDELPATGGLLETGARVGCQNWAMGCDQRFQAAGSYSLIRPPRIGRRRILP